MCKRGRISSQCSAISSRPTTAQRSSQHPRQGLHYIPPADWCARGGKSAYDRPEIISAYIQREVDLKRMAPLLYLPATASLQVSPFGAIPKKNKPEKCRLIVDLSSPEGYSVNAAIHRDLCSVLYTSVDKAVVLAQSLGQGCLLAKLGLQGSPSPPVGPMPTGSLMEWNNSPRQSSPVRSALSPEVIFCANRCDDVVSS